MSLGIDWSKKKTEAEITTKCFESATNNDAREIEGKKLVSGDCPEDFFLPIDWKKRYMPSEYRFGAPSSKGQK